jgi:hypothetical protein
MMYSRDMVLGLGNRTAPYVFLSELTYGGYQPLFDEERGKFLQENLPAVIVPGFAADTSEHLNPYTMAANAYYGSIKTHGYWIYVGSWPLLDAAAGRIAGMPFFGSPDEWAVEMKKVNPALRENLKNDSLTEFPYPLLQIRDRMDLRYLTEQDVKEHSSDVSVVSRPWKDEGLPWQGSELVLQSDYPMAHFSLSVTVTQKNRYRVFADLTLGPNRGIVQLLVDGQKIGSTFDAYLPILTPGQPIFLGECVLNPGEHQLQFQVVAKSARSQGYWIGLRGITLVAKGLSSFPQLWNVVGPFDNTDDSGFYTVYPPEQRINLSERYEGKNGIGAEWKIIRADSTGYLPLRPLSSEKSYVVAYALTYIYSPIDTSAKMLLGTDDGGKLWVNGELVWAMHTHRSAEPDQDRLYVRLKKGWNTILVKVTQAQWDWGLYLRLDDPEGEFQYALKPESVLPKHR